MKEIVVYYLPPDTEIPDEMHEGMFLSTGELSDPFREWIKKQETVEKYSLNGFAAAFNSDYISDTGYIFIEGEQELIDEFEQYKRESVKWSIEDFLDLQMPDGWSITPEQAQEALERMIYKHDASIGITWNTVEYYYREYGTKTEIEN